MSVLVWLLSSPSLASPLLFEHVMYSWGQDPSKNNAVAISTRTTHRTFLLLPFIKIVLSATNIYHFVVILSDVTALNQCVNRFNR